MRLQSLKFLIVFAIVAIGFSAAAAQTKTRKSTKKKPAAAKKNEPAAEPPQVVEAPAGPKANQRPSAEPADPAIAAAKSNARPASKPKDPDPVYFYEFSQPDFSVSKINLEHDENGKGKITFLKKDSDEPITDPIQLSSVSLERIKGYLAALDFLNSSENYQTPRSYAHMGVMKIKVKKEGKEREVSFDWSENKEAKALADEYRKLADQFVWVFDITLARDNQQLEAPKLMVYLESLLKREEISDPPQLIPFLKELSNDERIPLIGRNKAAKLIIEIEKKAAKK